MLGLGFNSNKLQKRGRPLSLQIIVDNYATLNAWSSENLSIVSTTTTMLDYKGVHNLPNPAAANQATYSASDVDFNNNPSLNYIADDYNYKAFSDYLIGETKGSIHAAFKTSADVTTTSNIFSSVNNTLSTNKIALYISGGFLYFLIRDTTNQVQNYWIKADQPILINTKYVVSVYQTGTTFKMFLNGVAQTLSVISTGTAQTFWFANVPLRLNMAIGASIASVSTYSNLKLGFVQITSDFDDATVLMNHKAIKKYYGF